MAMELRTNLRRLSARVIPVVFLAWAASVQAAEPYSNGLPPQCGVLKHNYGPFDYRYDQSKLPIVEEYHFTPSVEQLTEGHSGYVGGDLNYTLESFPNHPRALMAMIRLGERDRTDRPRGAQYTVECYLERAEAFAPDDGMVQLLYGIYLLTKGHPADALKRFQHAESLGPGSANLYYNMGLAYYRVKDYGKSLDYAHKAYALGFPLPGLKNMLERVGKWEPMEAKAKAPPEK